MATGALEAQAAERWSAELGEIRPWPRRNALAQPGARRMLRAALDGLHPLALTLAGLLALLNGSASAQDWLLVGGAMLLAGIWRWRGGRVSEMLDELRLLLVSVSLPVLIIAGLASVLSIHLPAMLAVRLWILALLLGAEAIAGRRWFEREAGAALLRPTLILGSGAVGRELASWLECEPRHGLRLVGLLEELPSPETLVERGVECIVIAFTGRPDSLLVPLVEQCRRLGVAVLAVPRLYEAASGKRTRMVGPLPLVELRALDPRRGAFWLKHALDRLLAAVLLALSAPLLGVLALAIKLESDGPILYRQRRVGRDGRQFTMLKLRTMRPAAALVPMFVPAPGCAPGGNELGDRCTRLGVWLRRCSLDELPQLVNVLRGEMSLIGPRPERPEYVERFSAEVQGYERRHRVKSGITGLAQVNGLRGQTSISNRARYDNAYIEHWSLWMDLKIVLRTIGVVVSLRGR